MAGLFALLAAGLLTAGAPAALAGKWAVAPLSCAKPQDAADAPTIIQGRTMSQHEASCTFASFRLVGPGRWTAKGGCVVEGNSQGQGTYRFERHGPQLRIQEPDTHRPTVLTHCRR